MKVASRNNITRVSIGIQARSTSERLPGKVLREMCGKPMLSWVVDACLKSSNYLNKPNRSRNIECSVALLIPKGDRIRDHFFNKVHIIEGDEFNVLSRYKACLDFFDADYVVRITSDCPLVSDAIITKCINAATMDGNDYVSNVDESIRLTFDGLDCEVISKRLLNYVYEHATTAHDKEHVTTLVRNADLPSEFKIGDIIPHCDLSHVKLSVDTEDDFKRVEEQLHKVIGALNRSKKLGHKTYRF